jgi:hypothetical protein
MHTPYVVILYKYLQEWKLLHQSEMPKNFKEKLAFKELVKKGEMNTCMQNLIERSRFVIL